MESSCNDAVVLVIIELKKVLVLIDPEWKALFAADDQAYIEELLSDFATRAEDDPAALFEQASQLNVGPLVTVEVGLGSSEDRRLTEMLQRFVSYPVGSL